jgi:MoxR-like ATPase
LKSLTNKFKKEDTDMSARDIKIQADVEKELGRTYSLKTDLEILYSASLAAWQNAMVICEPGWGKSKISYHMGKQAAGKEGTVFVPLSPSTPPEKITGPVSITALKKDKLEYATANTPYDPKADIVILDELYRSNDIIFDMLIHRTNDIVDHDNQPVFWGTSNWTAKSDRTEALRDRFALWYYFEPDGVDSELVIRSADISTWTFGLPNMKDVKEIRKVPMPRASEDAIVKAVEDLQDAIGNEKFKVTPRRVEAWRELLFRYSLLKTGKAEFKQVPADALRILKYAYPAKDGAEARKWAGLASTVVDVVGAKIEAYIQEAKKKFMKVTKEADPNQRAQFMAELGATLAESTSELEKLGEGDARVEQALDTFNKWFRAAAEGKKIG